MNSSKNVDFDNCVQSELEYLYEPADENTLYSNRFYDNQVAQTRCYNKQYNALNNELYLDNQEQVVEGFNDRKQKGYKDDDNMFQKFLCFLISVVAIILAVIFTCSMCQKHRGYEINDDVVYLGIPTESRISSTYHRY